MDISRFVYILAFSLVTCFLACLSGYIFSYGRSLPDSNTQTRAVRGITNAVGGFVLIWTILFVIDIAFFACIPIDGNNIGFPYQVLYFVDLFFWLPSVCYLSQALLQYKLSKWIWLPPATIPVLVCFVWFLSGGKDVLIYTAAVVLASFFVFAYFYSFSYRHYMRELKSEYSNLSHRDVRWTIYAYIGLVVQLLFYFYDFFFYSLFTSLFYDVITVFNALFIVYCAQHMLPLDNVRESEELENAENTTSTEASSQDTESEEDDSHKSTAIDTEMIRQRLISHCESVRLYLDPQLTRDTLCRNIGVNRNYLAQYFREQNISYYQYINTLRINYACELLSKSDVDTSIKDVALMSGYTSYRSFYNSFCEIKKCKPSDYMKGLKSLTPDQSLTPDPSPTRRGE